MTDYRKIAKEVAANIAAGHLLPGDRLPPQRIFAYEKGIAPSTAGRVYAELKRLGLIDGEVGRGTFVRATSPRYEPTLAEPRQISINMESNYPILPDQHQLLAPILATLASRDDVLHTAMQAATVLGDEHAKGAVATASSSQDWNPEPDSFLFSGNGRQSIAGAFSALAPIGGRIGFEETSYPVAVAIAARLGVKAVPVACDNEGMRPDRLEQIHRGTPLHAVYLQPTLQNPLGHTMSAQRRSEIAKILNQPGAPVAVEDRIYAFLDENAPPPLAAFAPDKVIVVNSLSKIISPGLSFGFASVPKHLIEPMATALKSGAWAPQRFSLEFGVRCLLNGSAQVLIAEKRADAQNRQSLVQAKLKRLRITANPLAYHLVIHLPAHWRAESYAQAAKDLGIAITPGSAFAVTRGHAPNFVRLALAPPTPDELMAACGVLTSLFESKKE